MAEPRRLRAPARLRAVLLDIDGTLVDSNDAHARAWEEVFRRHGRDVPYDAIRDAIGKGGDKLVRELAHLDDDEGEGAAIADERKALFQERFLPHLRAIAGARALVERLLAEGLVLGVATSASDEEVGGLLRVAGVDDLLRLRTSADDADRSKPDPDIVNAALGRVSARADETILLGDTPYDVEAAVRAGVAPVGVESGGWRAADLAPAIAVYRDAADLLARFDASPFAASPPSRRAPVGRTG
jgi:HAD superfamily hydrolase (TIGR01509 family)